MPLPLTPLTELGARAVLESARQRFKLAGVHSFALRPASFIAVLRASPGLIRWEKLAESNEYVPMFNVRGVDWRIVLTDSGEGFRAKIVGPLGSYLEAAARDIAGAIAIEFAILMPVLLMALGQGIDIFQLMSLHQDVAFVAQGAATAGAAVIAKGGSHDEATSKAMAVVAANGVLFNSFTTLNPVVISYTDDGMIAVTVGASAPALFPMFTPTVSTSVTTKS